MLPELTGRESDIINAISVSHPYYRPTLTDLGATEKEMQALMQKGWVVMRYTTENDTTTWSLSSAAIDHQQDVSASTPADPFAVVMAAAAAADEAGRRAREADAMEKLMKDAAEQREHEERTRKLLALLGVDVTNAAYRVEDGDSWGNLWIGDIGFSVGHFAENGPKVMFSLFLKVQPDHPDAERWAVSKIDTNNQYVDLTEKGDSLAVELGRAIITVRRRAEEIARELREKAEREAAWKADWDREREARMQAVVEEARANTDPDDELAVDLTQTDDGAIIVYNPLNAESRAAYLKTRTELIDAGYDPLSRSTICDHAHDCDLIVVEFERVRRPAPNPLKEVQAEAQPEPEPAPVRMIEEVIDLPTLVPIPAGQGFSENIVIIGLEDSPRQTMPGFPSLSAYMAAGRTFADWQRDSDQAVITRGRQTAMRLMEQMS